MWTPCANFQKMKKKLNLLYLLIVAILISGMLPACLPEEPSNGENELEMDTQENVLIIAHRGARSLAPENTIAAAIKALETDADGWELDVAMSLDGELVVIHDDTLERTSNAKAVFPDRSPWSVDDFTYEELTRLDFGSWFVDSDPLEQTALGNITDADIEKYRGEKIPTLREALIFTKENNWWVNVEIKDASGTPADAMIVSGVVDLIIELDMQESVLISSFNHNYLKQVRSLNKDIATGALVNKIVKDPIALMEELDAQAFHPGMQVTYAKQVQSLREAGYDVNVWTVNEESDLRDLIAMGVTGIITDFPQDFVPLLRP